MVIQRRRSGQLKVLGHIICNRSQWKDKARTRSDWKIDNQHFATVHINTVDQGQDVLGHVFYNSSHQHCRPGTGSFGTQSATDHIDTEDQTGSFWDTICNITATEGLEVLAPTICNKSHRHWRPRTGSFGRHNLQQIIMTLLIRDRRFGTYNLQQVTLTLKLQTCKY